MRSLAQRVAAAALAVAVPFAASAAMADETPAPLSLDGAIALALKGNLALGAAHIAVASAAAQLRQSHAPQAPGVQLRDTYQYVDPVAKLSTPFGSLPFSTTNATNVPLLALQYNLYDGGLTAARIAQAAAGLAAAEDGERRARSVTIAATTKSYFDLVAAERLADVAHHAVDSAQAHVAQTQSLLAEGQIPRADLLRAESELASERVNAIAADGAVGVAQTALDATLGVPLSNVYAPTESLDTAPPSFALPALVTSALASRADLAAAQASVAAATAALDQARAGSLPTVGVTVATGNTQPAVVGGYHNQFSLGIAAVWTLFDHGYTAGGVAAAKAGIAAANNGLAQLRTGVELEVRQDYVRYDQAVAATQAAQHYVAFADESLRLAEVRYRGGVGTSLEVQDAQVQDRSAQQALVSARIAVRESVAALRLAAGLL